MKSPFIAILAIVLSTIAMGRADFDAAGTPVIRMMPNSFAIVEW